MLSPSYELARRFRQGTLTPDDKARLPGDFENVLSVYDDLGDVHACSYSEWWQERGLDNFGIETAKPQVRWIATIKREPGQDGRIAEALAGYLNGAWVKEGRQSAMVISIPLGMTRARISKQIHSLLDQYPAESRRLRAKPPRYRLKKGKTSQKTLLRYLRVLWFRAAKPSDKLWQVGVRSKVSDKLSRSLKPDAARISAKDRDNVLKLSITTSRALRRGQMLAENAARGVFPSYADCPEAVKLEPADVRKLIVARLARERREASGLPN